MSRRALVTGASGFIGRHTVDALLDAGDTVHLLTSPRAAAWCEQRWGGRGTICHVYDGTLASAHASLRAAEAQCVFHLATRFLATHGSADVDPLIASNIVFGAHLLDAMDSHGTPLLVSTASTWQTMNGSAYCPANLYAATKQAFDDLARYYHDVGRFRVQTLHIFDSYGPDDPRGKLIGTLCDAARNPSLAKPMALSAGEQHLDLLHVNDIVAALLLARDQRSPAMHYALRSGATHSLRSIAEQIERIGSCQLPITWGARPYRPREIMTPLSPHPTLPGWTPRISLADGLASLITGSS